MNSVTKRLIAVLIALLCVVAAISGYYFYGMDGTIGGGKPVEVSDFVNKSLDDVKEWQKENELPKERVELSYEYDDNINPEIVISQSINPGEKLKKDEVIKFVLSAGPDPDKEYVLPDFKDQTKQEIDKWFEDNHFTNVTFSYENSDEVEEDKLISIKPESGSDVKASDEIEVLFSSGKGESSNEVSVPDFKPYRFNEMQKWGKDNGVNVEFKFEENTKIGRGQYVSQDPKEGTIVEKGGKVVIVLSNGKGFPITSFVGKPKKDAQNWVSKNKANGIFLESYSNEPIGNIVAQNPNSGNVFPTTKINFFVSVGKVPVLDYRNKTKVEFDNYIAWLNKEKNQSAKLTANVVSVKSDKKAGTILEQSPIGEVPVGSTITIKVAASQDSFDPAPYIKKGQSFNALDAKIRAIGGNWKIDRKEQVDNSLPVGTIIAGSVDGNVIHVTVSTQDAPSDKSSVKTGEVPSVVGRSKDEALSLLKQAGYTNVKIIEDNLNKNAYGTIAGQKPAPGSKEPTSKEILIILSTNKGN